MAMDSVDKIEVERFAAMAGDWWNPLGKFRPLHQINPVRLAYIREQILSHGGIDGRAIKPFAGLTILDVGCGGGLVCEPLARLGARVTGLDPAEENIAVARAHAREQGLAIDYLAGTTWDLAARGPVFDHVAALEVVEHVPDVAAFLRSCAALLKPGGLLLLSTLNRTAKSYALGIVVAEHIFGWLPRGTHQWERFVTPDELSGFLRDIGLEPQGARGMVFSPIGGNWKLSDDCDVNYLMAARKPADAS